MHNLIVTHWDYEGKGYMAALIERGEKELEELNVDVARLGGLRSRYNRYGFESAGRKFGYCFTAKNREKKFSDFQNNIEFVKIEKQDKEVLEFAASVYNQNEIAVTRTAENAYYSMTAWRKIPYLAIRGGQPLGYVSVNESGQDIAEAFAVNTEEFIKIICAWQEKQAQEIYFFLQPHQAALIKVFSSVCESAHVTSPSHFYIRNWEKTVGAFMRLKASYCTLPKGEVVIEIEDYGKIHIFVREGEIGAEKTEKTPDFTMDRLTATRYIFGTYPCEYTGKVNATTLAWFPLPLGWNGQDRV